MEVSEALTKIESTINRKLIEERQDDQHKKWSVFEDLQDGSKDNSAALIATLLHNY